MRFWKFEEKKQTMKWSPWVAAAGSGIMKKLHVKVSQLKLQVCCKENVEDRDLLDKMVLLEMKWKGPKAGGVLAPFYRKSTCQRNYTGRRRFLRKGEPIEWDEEFESVCNFSASKDGSFGSWKVSFNVLYGDSTEKRSKSAVLGKVSLNLAELASKKETQIERKLPITLQDGRLAKEATLLTSLSFVEVRDSPHDSPGISQNFAESDKDHLLRANGNDLTGLHKKQKPEASSSYSDESGVLDPGGSNEATSTSDNSYSALTLEGEPESFPSSDTQLDPVWKRGLFSGKRKRGPAKRKAVPLTSGPPRKADGIGYSPESEFQEDNCIASNWEVKELVSRDGQAKLKTNVFFASFDQRSEQAAGESACTALVTVFAHWLHSNQGMPTRSQFDSLIIKGSSEWRKLCTDHTYINCFPDKHFDLDTILEANLRPLSVLHEKSFIGFFCPEKFECLKEAMSFHEIWDKINSNTEDCESGIYIVSWNDHFFVLKVEADAYYIIDSLGERLFEGCNQAYILKFDDSSLVYEVAQKAKVGSEEMEGADSNCKEESEEIICRGKECCKEFINRFLAAIPVRELEEEQEKSTISNYALHQRLQIELHLCVSLSPSSSSSSSSATSSTSSLMSSMEFM